MRNEWNADQAENWHLFAQPARPLALGRQSP
jgi:hypothetical protein